MNLPQAIREAKEKTRYLKNGGFYLILPLIHHQADERPIYVYPTLCASIFLEYRLERNLQFPHDVLHDFFICLHYAHIEDTLQSRHGRISFHAMGISRFSRSTSQ